MIRYLQVLIVLCCTLQLTTADATQPARIISVDSKTMTHAFGDRQVVCEISSNVESGLAPGRAGNITISFSSLVSGAKQSDNAKAVVQNGLIAVALPPGLEMAGDARMHYFNPTTGKFEFMYSGSYPSNALTKGLDQAIANASASNPRLIISGLTEICEKLSPGSGFSAPRDPRINGLDPAYSVIGKSWLIPVSQKQDEVVNTFSLSDSLASDAIVSISFPFRVTGNISGSPVVVYAGGLSTGAAQEVMRPADIPAGALPLMPISVDEHGNIDSTPIPANVYSHQWVTWETEFILSDFLTGQGMRQFEDQSGFGDQGNSEVETYASTQETETSTTPEPFKVPFIGFDSGERPVQPQPLPETEPREVDVVVSAPKPDEQPAPPVTSPVTVSDAQYDPGTSVTDVVIPGEVKQPVTEVIATQDVREPIAATADSESGREVELGTIPEQDTDYRVPLKEITGSAQSSVQPMQQDWKPDNQGGGPAFLDEMVFVEEGYFLMGTSNLSSAGDQDELPQTSVFLPDFYIDKYPLTNRKFQEFVIDAGYNPQGKWRKYYSKGTADLPVRGVTWNDANEYALWAGKRLPTEAEWEKAARGVDGRLYPWGDDWSSDILPRGELIYDIMHAPNAASPYGAMAMVGVFWQWTSSQFAVYPYDPDAVSDEYVLRGGCFSNGRNIVRCANRYSQPPNVALNTFGFRCASDPQ